MTTTSDSVDLLEDLRGLPACDADARTAERVRKTSMAAFVAERDLGGRPWWTTAAVRTGRVAMPIFLAGTVGIYLTWAVGVAASVYH